LLNVSEEDLVASLAGEYTLDTPVLDETGIHVDHGEHRIDVSRDPMRFIHDRSKPFYVAGTRITFIVPFAGDPNLLSLQPQNLSYSLGGSNVEVVGSEIHVSYAGANLSGERTKRDFDTELKLIKQNLANLKTATDRHNAGLSHLIRIQIQQRKSKLLSDANLAASIGFPIRHRDSAPTTYAVPVQKRKPKVERTPVAAGPFQPEPVLAMVEYDEILKFFAIWFE
jgi:hypothetical protein